MRKTLFIIAVLTVVLFLSVPVNGNSDSTGVTDMLRKASWHLLDKTDNQADGKMGFTILMEAIVKLTPRCSFPAAFQSKITSAHSQMKKTSIFDPHAVDMIKEAYRLINGNRDYELSHIKSLDDALELGRKLFNKSQTKLAENDPDSAVKSMMEVAVLVVTPVKKKH